MRRRRRRRTRRRRRKARVRSALFRSGNYDGEVINQLTHTHLSLLYWKRNASWWYASTLHEKCWLIFLILFENLTDSFKKVLIDSFEDFLVDKFWRFSGWSGESVSKYPKFQVRQFQIFGHIFTPDWINTNILIVSLEIFWSSL